MPDTENTATLEAPATPEPSYASVLEASFNEAQKEAGGQGLSPQDVPPVEFQKQPNVIPAVAPKEIRAPSADAEFPNELLTGDKPEPVAATPAVDELEGIQLHGNVKAETRASFDNLKNIARTEKAAVAQLRAELEALKTTTKPAGEPEELVQARAKIAELEDAVERGNFESTPGYQRVLNEQKQNITDAKAYLEGSEINPSIVELAASLTGAKRVSALREAGVDAETIAAISTNLATVDRLKRQQTELLENRKTISTQWEAQQRQQAEAEEAAQTASEKAAFQDAMAEVESNYDFLKVFPGHDKYNEQIAGIKAKSEEMFLTPKPAKDQAVIVAKGTAFDLLHRMYTKVREDLKAERTRNTQLTAAQPSGGNGATKPDGAFAMTAATPEQLRDERAAMFDQGMGR